MTQQANLPIIGDTDASLIEDKFLRYSVSLVTQGDHRFYTLTIPSDILAKTCFVTTREEDPDKGFQRFLDQGRAKQIADYVDSGLGTIPNSIVLSAQPEAEMRDVGRGKTIEFRANRKAFLVIDGQHRVFGFSLAKNRLRVPVVIYNGLSKRDESRLFIDINTKQRPVPSELLLDIKKLAEYETNSEKLSGEIYDYFHTEPGSPLFGLTSPFAKTKGKISRVTFYSAFRPLMPVFKTSDAARAYAILADYIRAFKASCAILGVESAIVNPTMFRALMQVFPEVAASLKAHAQTYNTDNFSAALAPIFQRTKPSDLRKPPQSSKALAERFSNTLRQGFTV